MVLEESLVHPRCDEGLVPLGTAEDLVTHDPERD